MDKHDEDIVNKRRKELTNAAYRVVSKKGYYNFTVRDIANEAGLSAGLVHYYFKDKQELLITLLKEMNSNLKFFLNKELGKSDDPLQKLLTFIDQAFRLVEREKDYFYVVIDFWTQMKTNERIRKANTKLYKSFRDECSAILEEGIRMGVFNPVDVQYIAMVIVSIVQGTIIQYIIDNNAFDYTEYTKKIKDLILQAILKK